MVLYALHDYDKTKSGMFPIKPEDAKELNRQGYGIHWMPQIFKGTSRKTEDLVKIRFWLADIDTGDKDTMLARINSLPVPTTCLVETKRGFHCYWLAKNATIENYATIERGISEFLCADNSLITPTHTLRAPGFFHMKDPKHPFLIKTIWRIPSNQYSEELMLRVYKPKQKNDFVRSVSFNNDLKKITDIGWLKTHFELGQIGEGGRNNALNRVAYFLSQNGLNEESLYQVMCNLNMQMPQPLDLNEVRSIVRGKFKR